MTKLAAFFAASVLVFAACSKDEEKSGSDSGPIPPKTIIPTPGTAARYDVVTEDGLVDFVELTTTGTYIVGERQTDSNAKTRGAEDVVRVVEGTVTSKEGNEYQLNGWGTIVVKTTEAGDAFLLSVTPTGGTTEELPVTLTKASFYDATALKMSAAWELASLRLELRVLTSKFEREGTLDELPQMQEDLIHFLEGIVDDLPESVRESIDIYNLVDLNELITSPNFFTHVTFTTTGTVVTKRFQESAVGAWKWTETEKSFMVAYPYEQYYAAGVSFRNDQLRLEPVIEALEDAKERLGAVGSLAFSCHAYAFFDKAK